MESILLGNLLSFAVLAVLCLLVVRSVWDDFSIWVYRTFRLPRIMREEHQRRLNELHSRSFDWYRSAHPNLVSPSGHVSCSNCGSDRINAEHMPQWAAHRRHYCRQCGTTLYYSPLSTTA